MTYAEALKVAACMNAHGDATLITAYNALYAAGNFQACDAILEHMRADMY